MEQGFQTAVDPAKASFYHGTETDRQTPPRPRRPARRRRPAGPAPDQATQLADALQLAYCQPAVAAFFNFELADETDLAGWQSGLLWADLTPKPSYQRVQGRGPRRRRRAASTASAGTPKAAADSVPVPRPARHRPLRRRGGPPDRRSSVRGVFVRSLAEADPFTTADGSTIRELLGLPTAPIRNQSLAEATLEPGQATERHYHAETEEIYYVVEGTGEMELDGDRRQIEVGDAVLIPPGAWHQIRAARGAAALPLLLRARVPARGHVLRLSRAGSVARACSASRSASRSSRSTATTSR